MAVSPQLLDFLKEQMAEFGGVTARRMFGGAGLFRDGLMFALVADEVLYFKADAENVARFDAEGLAPFAYDTKNGRQTVLGYRRAPERCLDDAGDMAEWCRLAWGAALRANAPKLRPKRAPNRP
jgi:DNA transformation protein